MGLISDYCTNKLFSITPPFRANCSTGERGEESNRGLIERRRLAERERERDIKLSEKDRTQKINKTIVGIEMEVRDWQEEGGEKMGRLMIERRPGGKQGEERRGGKRGGY